MQIFVELNYTYFKESIPNKCFFVKYLCDISQLSLLFVFFFFFSVEEEIGTSELFLTYSCFMFSLHSVSFERSICLLLLLEQN